MSEQERIANMYMDASLQVQVYLTFKIKRKIFPAAEYLFPIALKGGKHLPRLV